MRRAPLVVTACIVALLSAPSSAAPKATPAEAKAFAARTNEDLLRLLVRQSTAEWIKSTYITDDTERNASWANEDLMAYLSKAIRESRRFDGLDLDPDTKRTLYLLKVSSALPAPADPAKRAELASIADRLEGIYGKGKWCGKDGKGACKDLNTLEDLMGDSRNYDELLDAWAGWHTISKPMRPMYERMVSLVNEGAREIGFANAGDLWRAGYDMPPADFEKETDRLWLQVKPLYDQLHCYVRARLAEKYGADKVPPNAPIPAHLLGNMWAQEWTKIYPLVEPYPGHGSLDVTAALVAQKYDPIRMVKLGEAFYTSLGLDPLPESFWERSMFKKPADRDVVCHASAWDVQFDNDLRIKTCIRIEEEDLVTIHHELGHDYYFHAYYRLPALFQAGANDGFHEAIGDTIALSVTPAYLKRVGLLTTVPSDEPGEINTLMKEALSKVAFLPFGKLIDQWRWDVFAGKVTPASYDQAWWDLRRRYQGVAAPIARSEEDFDPGAKYHVAASVPYMRYFLAEILQFQFYRALCKAAGHRGPLHTCSFYGSKDAGRKLQAMQALGASKPWPDALEVITGQRRMDATALTEYFAPLQKWLEAQNKGRRCGW